MQSLPYFDYTLILMKIPLSLLRSYIHLDEPLAQLAETLTLLGIEVEGILNETPRFSHVVAAEVRAVKPHPAADKLQIAEVFDGAKSWQVVCGARNCRAGLKTAFARIGAILYSSEGKEIRIVETSIRGTASFGMLCSALELGIPSDSDGILELPSDLQNGRDLSHLLSDPVLELSLTANLGHCMSALGVARELSAALQKPISRHKLHLRENTDSQISDKAEVSINDAKLCPRYCCRLIEHVKVGPSPFWLKQTLLAAGMRPINNIVDITNYILLKTGQPLHAFDADRIDGHILSVQTAETAQPFEGIDRIVREIPVGALVICDNQKPVALAGIMGGANSSVSENTRSILLEAAAFDPLSIRKTARAVDLRTESSQRFEKGIDWQAIPDALNEACQLISELASGTVSSGMIDLKPHKFPHREIALRPDRANKLLGTSCSVGEIEDILNRLGCKASSKATGELKISIPSYRNDLNEEIDLIEEIARIYGYNNIEKKLPVCATSQIPDDPEFLFEKEIRRRMAAQGLQEILNCDLISPKLASLLPDLAQSNLSLVQVRHAKNEEFSFLRPSLLPGILETVRSNLDQRNASLNAFELGRIHFKQKASYAEIPMLAVVLYGKIAPHHWDEKPKDADFYDLKGSLETLLDALGIASVSFKPSAHLSFHPSRQADLHSDGLAIGSLGEIHPRLLDAFGIDKRVLFAEVNLQHLLGLRNPCIKMAPIPQFPATERDWTIPLPKGFEFASLMDAIRSFSSPILEKAELLDLYVFEQNGETKRNATLRFVYRDALKTISFEEAEGVHSKLMDHVAKFAQLKL